MDRPRWPTPAPNALASERGIAHRQVTNLLDIDAQTFLREVNVNHWQSVSLGMHTWSCA